MRGDILVRVEVIGGYWKNSCNYHLCNGTIIVQDDGWFEGFIKERNEKTGVEATGFIFGIYFPSKMMELFCCHSGLISRFYCEKDVNSFIGVRSSIGPYMGPPSGQCNFIVSTNSIYSLEEAILKTNIAKGLIDDRANQFYHKILENKNKLMILECYQNRKLEKISDILEMPEGNSKYQKALKHYQQ